MEVLITGVGDAFTTRHFGSSALIHGPGGYVQLDCPEPYFRVLHEATETAGWAVSPEQVNNLIITHLHGDHCHGLELFGSWRRIKRTLLAGGQPPDAASGPTIPTIHAAEPVLARVWEKLAPSLDRGHTDDPRQLEDFFRTRELMMDAPSEVAGMKVRIRPTGHPVPTFGLLISCGDRTLGWSSDTPFEPAHIDWLSEADLIVHECNLGAAHTPIEKLNELPSTIRSKMRLIHLPDDFDPARTDIEILRQGQVVHL